MVQLTAKQKAELYRKALLPGQALTERELIFLEYSFDTNQADAVYKACQAKLLEKNKENSSKQGLKDGKKNQGVEDEGGEQPGQLVFGKEQRSAQVYAQVSSLKRQTLQSAYMVDQEAQADIKLDAELEDEQKEREYQVSKQVEQNKVSGQGPADRLSGASALSAITDDAAASPGKDQKKAAQAEKTVQPRKQLKRFMQPIGKTRSRANYARRQDRQGLRGSTFSVNPEVRSGSSTSDYQALRNSAAVPSTVDGYHKYELPARKAEAEEAQKFLRSMTSAKAQTSLMHTKTLINA